MNDTEEKKVSVKEETQSTENEEILNIGAVNDPSLEDIEHEELTDAPESEKKDLSKWEKIKRFVKNNTSKGLIDRPMLIIIFLLVAFGSIMVFSASYAYAYSRNGDSAFFIKRQLLWVSLGIVAMLFASKVNYKLYKKLSFFIYIGSIGLLMLVLVFGMAAGVAQRWINIAGISFQPSEFAKLALIIILAWYADYFSEKINCHEKKSFVYGILIPAGMVGIVCVLVLLENHLSGTIILFLIGAICMWAMGSSKKVFIIASAAALVLVGAVLLVVWFKDSPSNKIIDFIPDYVVKRIDMWLRPDNYTVLDDTWQTVQGKIAVGSGGFFGTGFGKSFQKHLFVSQPQNDFIFAIICEELGFVGAAGLIMLYIAFIYRGLLIAKNAPDVFSTIVAIGIVGHVGIQAFLNMLVVSAVLPNTGISLPLVSYGGSSLIMLMAELGVLLSISRRSRIQK